MRKVTLFASFVICLAEHCLRGQRAWAWRVEWLKTPCLVASRDHLAQRYGLFPEIVGKSMNPTTDAYCFN